MILKKQSESRSQPEFFRATSKMKFQGSSPIDFIRPQRFLFKAMDLIEDEGDSKVFKRVHKSVLFFWRATMFVGALFQDSALFMSATPEVKSSKRFMALSTSKILIKLTVFLMQKRGITQMWQQLNNQTYNTRNFGEKKWAFSVLMC